MTQSNEMTVTTYDYKNALGYYDSPDQKQGEAPVNPSIDLPCPYCNFPMSEMNIRTHGFMNMKHRLRSYFYRTHKTCDEKATPEQQQHVFDNMTLASEAAND